MHCQGWGVHGSFSIRPRKNLDQGCSKARLVGSKAPLGSTSGVLFRTQPLGTPL